MIFTVCQLVALNLWCFGVMNPNDGNVLVEIQAQNVLIIAVPYSNQPSAIQQSNICSCQIKLN